MLLGNPSLIPLYRFIVYITTNHSIYLLVSIEPEGQQYDENNNNNNNTNRPNRPRVALCKVCKDTAAIHVGKFTDKMRKYFRKEQVNPTIMIRLIDTIVYRYVFICIYIYVEYLHLTIYLLRDSAGYS